MEACGKSVGLDAQGTNGLPCFASCSTMALAFSQASLESFSASALIAFSLA
ncbi:hypothetical protein D3C84_1218530 [compost metagenome]